MLFTLKQNEALDLLGSDATDIHLYGGSRSGKTTIILYALDIRALKEPYSRHCIFRYHLTDVYNSIFLDSFPKVLNLINPQIYKALRISNDKSALYVKFPNGSEIWFAGLDTADRAEKVLGREFSSIYFNEISQIPFSSVLKAKTRLAQKNNLVKKSYYDENPAGKRYWSYKLFIEKTNPKDNTPLANPQNYTSMLMNPIDNIDNIDNNFIKILEEYPQDEKNRFLYGIFNSGIDGAIYNREFGQAEQEQRIGNFDYNPKFPVFTGWDIGVTDKTAIWFAQFIQDKIYIIDYYENQFQGVEHYVSVLKDKGYNYALHFFPFDVKNSSWSTGKSRRETAISLGIEPRIMPNLKHDDRISAVRSIFPRCYFDKKRCADGLDCLSSYKTIFDEKKGVHGTTPYHDWASDGATAFENIALGYKESFYKPEKTEIKKIGYTFNDMLKQTIKARESIYRKL